MKGAFGAALRLARRGWRRRESLLPAGVLVGAAITVLVGLLITRDSRAGLGTPLSPFLMSYSPVLRRWVFVAALVAIAGVGIAPRLIARMKSPAGFAGGVYLLSIALGLGLNVARRGPGGWDYVFDLSPRGAFEAKFEYLSALPVLHRSGLHYYIQHFSQVLPYLSTHTKGNPPGPVVLMDLLSIDTPAKLAAACIALGALTAPLAYGLGRILGGERRGRIAAVLAAFSPAVLLFGVTSVDYAFAGLGALAAWLLVCQDRRAWATGSVVAAIGSFFSWLLLAIPVWAVLVVLRRDGLRAAVRLAAGCAAALLAFYLILAATLGYDPISVVRALARIYAAGAAAHRPYAFWLFGSPAAWLLMLGPPLAWILVQAVSRGDAAALAVAALVVISALGGFTKAETERIWLAFVPLAAVAAAAIPIRRLHLWLIALAVQALVIEILFDTIW